MIIWLAGRWYFKRSKNQRNLRKEVLHPAIRAYRQLRFQLAEAGLPLIATQTPLEFYEQSGEDLRSYPELMETLTLSTKLYEETVYSPEEPDVESPDAIKKTVEEIHSRTFALVGRI